MNDRQPDGTSLYDRLYGRWWPKRRIIWSCQADRGPLLTRYFLLRTPFVAVYLHHLHASDEDRALHDHPWSFITFLLTSGYYEHTPLNHEMSPMTLEVAQELTDALVELGADEHTIAISRQCIEDLKRGSYRTWRPRFSILWRPAEWRHRLELVKPCWTLVVRFRRRREWGFITKGGWMDWKSYGKEWCD